MPKILYVEDNEDSRNLLFRRLQLQGNYEVLLANDGLQGVTKAREEKPDIILMDMGLPVMDGWEASRQIKTNPATAHIPIIALTAYSMSEDREKTIQAGCDDYHTKPIRIENLLHQIESLINKRKESEEKQKIPEERFQSVSMDIQITRGRILVVDDAQENRNMLSSRIRLEGYPVETAENGATALEMLNHTPFDLILLDILMPDLNGIEVLHSIRRKDSLLDLPVIMVTARDSQDYILKAFQEGANDYVTKPIEMKILLARIHTQLRIHFMSRWKDQFLSIAGHDLKNPLSIIYGYIDIIIKSYVPGSPMNRELYSYLMKISKNAEIMKHIITEFLDLKILENGQLKLTYREIDLINLIRETMEGFKPMIQDKNISFQIDQAKEIIKISGDEEKLIQVIQNLAHNAIKYAVPETGIMIRATKEDKWVLAEISNIRETWGNQGDEKHQAPDTRLEEMFLIGEKGFNPGLIISKLLIEAHGGKIGIEKKQDKTTTLWFRLPLQ
jgi:CheY-like chemotaxis protein